MSREIPNSPRNLLGRMSSNGNSPKSPKEHIESHAIGMTSPRVDATEMPTPQSPALGEDVHKRDVPAVAPAVDAALRRAVREEVQTLLASFKQEIVAEIVQVRYHSAGCG